MGRIEMALSDSTNIFCLQIVCKKKAPTREKPHKCLILKWAHLGLNQGPPDYESGALTS